MLILTRRCEEEIVVDNQIRIRILSTSGGRVKVGVSAPAEIPIHRQQDTDGLVLDCQSILVPEAEAVAG